MASDNQTRRAVDRGQVIYLSDDSEDEFQDAPQSPVRSPVNSVSNTTRRESHDRSEAVASHQVIRRRRISGREKIELLGSIMRDNATVTITLINDTNCILNVAIKTLTPFAFENKVMPGHTVAKRVPRFVYTIEARVWTGNNDYTIAKVELRSNFDLLLI